MLNELRIDRASKVRTKAGNALGFTLIEFTYCDCDHGVTNVASGAGYVFQK